MRRKKIFRPRPLKLRPQYVPDYWRMVTDGAPPRSFSQQEQWVIVLAARHVPFVVQRRGQKDSLYVPPLYEAIAKAELREYSHEGAVVSVPEIFPVHAEAPWAVTVPLGLLVWHGARVGWWTAPHSALAALGALDTVRIKVYHEWYRAVTALTLHADSTHVLGNVAFGTIFLYLLCRAQGLGLGILLAFLGGTLGNVCNVLLRFEAHVSLGFSTALFAAVGALSGGLMLQGEKSKALVPLAAGAAILAMLGTEGERTDYVAHVSGLIAGVLLGMGAQYVRQRFGIPPWGQWLAGILSMALVVGCWLLAGVL